MHQPLAFMPALPVSRHRSDVVGCAQPSERSARRIACPYRAVLASDATPRGASMASADRQMIGDATPVPADAPERHRLAPCAHGWWYFLAPGNRCKVAARCICGSLPMTPLRPFPAPCRLRLWLHWSLLAATLGATLGALCGSAGAQQTKQLTFAHQDMLVPLRLVMESGELEKATGYKIHWRMFAGGGDVIRAMASGAGQMGETGSSPLTAAASQGQGIQLFWISADIANAEALVARKDSGIARKQDLAGKKVATPFVSTAHYQLMAGMKMDGVDPKGVNVMNMRPPEIAAAWER